MRDGNGDDLMKMMSNDGCILQILLVIEWLEYSLNIERMIERYYSIMS